jgi:uncharacterized protein YecE (DUF72 family)
MSVWIGTSGWQYRHWRNRLYPTGLPTSRWLDRYVEAFDTVELNVTFYRQPKNEVFEAWARRVPDGFLFAVKASRFLTHIKRLRDPQDSVDRLMDGASRLGSHLGPILVQLPPDFEVETERLAETLAAFPPGIRVTVEPRHRSWFTQPVMATLEERDAALCWADRRGPLTPERATADWGYVRFHGGRASPRSCYSPEALESWVDRVRVGWPPTADVFAYFNNDHNGCAPRDAAVFAELALEAGLSPTGVPSLDMTPVG